jgi:hypothetical protein
MKRLALLLVTLLALLASIAAVSAVGVTAKAAPSLAGITGGSAYAGFLQVPAGSSLASVGPLFPATLGCTLSNQTVEASADSAKLSSFSNSGPVVDTVTTSRTSTSIIVQASSEIRNLTLLAGLITAKYVNAVANSTANSSSASSSNTSTFTDLVVAGVPITSAPAPNTTIPLANLGSVTLNEQAGPSDSADATSISVTAIDVSVTTANAFGLPAGTHILIAHAQTGFTRTATLASVSASAYGLYALGNARSGLVASGPWAPASIGCTGGSSTVSMPGANIFGDGSTGTITDTAFGQITASGANANSSSTVQDVNLLNGMITASQVTSTAQASEGTSSTGTASATTTLSGGVVNGNPLSADPGPNTKITIAGLGYVIVNEQVISMTSTGASAQVNAFDLYVTETNLPGLPAGTRIIVGHSDAGVTTA